MDGGGCGTAQLLAVLACVGQASARSFLQNLPLEGGENGQHGRHRPSGGRGQIQRLGQRYETHSEMLQFLEGGQQIRDRPAPAVQAPDQHHIYLSTPSGRQ